MVGTKKGPSGFTVDSSEAIRQPAAIEMKLGLNPESAPTKPYEETLRVWSCLSPLRSGVSFQVIHRLHAWTNSRAGSNNSNTEGISHAAEIIGRRVAFDLK